MPMLIEFIDKIARDKHRDVLCLSFTDIAATDVDEDEEEFLILPTVDWENHASRAQIIAWLESNAIAWKPCGGLASTDSLMPYQGQIYIDVPFDEASSEYQRLVGFIEDAEGSVQWPGVDFYYVPLELAMKNAHHDEPGFWEHIADQF